MRMSALILCYCEATTYSDGGAENDGHKNDGPSKLQISVDRRSRPMHVRWATLCLVSILWGCYISLYHKLLICWIWASYSKNKKVLSAVLLRENTIVLQNGDGNWCYEHNPSYLATIWSKANYRAKLLTVSVVVTGVQSLGGENQNVSTQVDCTFTKKLAVTDWTVCSHQNRLQSTPNFVRLLSCTVKHTVKNTSTTHTLVMLQNFYTTLMPPGWYTLSRLTSVLCAPICRCSLYHPTSVRENVCSNSKKHKKAYLCLDFDFWKTCNVRIVSQAT